MQSVSLYLHFPFCVHRCCYCDFNTYSGLERLIPEYVEALCTEVNIVSNTISEAYRIGTVYLGGGTPSLLSARHFESIYETLTRLLIIESDAEITMEVNPGTVTLTYLKAVHDLGINRLSIGMQSSNPFDLRFLERKHNFFDVIKAFQWSREAGFENINLDMIFGIPGQSIERWKESLGLALKLLPDHLSIYALTIEDRTPLGKWMEKGLVELPNTDVSADMYEYTQELLSNFSYHHYEISNWEKLDTPGKSYACRHNLQYWQNLPYLGLGAGAHGYINNWRTVNIHSPIDYIHRLKNAQGIVNNDMTDTHDPFFPHSPAIVEKHKIDKKTEMSETMIMGLRLVDKGIDRSNFHDRFGIPIEDVFGVEIDNLIRLGLLEWIENQRIKLTYKGRLLGNQVFMKFV